MSGMVSAVWSLRWPLMVAACCLAILWAQKTGAELKRAQLDLLSKQQKIEALSGALIDQEERHARDLALVAAEAKAARTRARAIETAKQKVKHAENGPVPAPVRAALDAIGGLRVEHAGGDDR